MSLEGVLKPEKEIERAGSEVPYEDEDYDIYFTSEDLILLHKEREFISK